MDPFSCQCLYKLWGPTVCTTNSKNWSRIQQFVTVQLLALILKPKHNRFLLGGVGCYLLRYYLDFCKQPRNSWDPLPSLFQTTLSNHKSLYQSTSFLGRFTSYCNWRQQNFTSPSCLITVFYFQKEESTCHLGGTICTTQADVEWWWAFRPAEHTHTQWTPGSFGSSIAAGVGEVQTPRSASGGVTRHCAPWDILRKWCQPSASSQLTLAGQDRAFATFLNRSEICCPFLLKQVLVVTMTFGFATETSCYPLKTSLQYKQDHLSISKCKNTTKI